MYRHYEAQAGLFVFGVKMGFRVHFRREITNMLKGHYL